MYLSLSLCLSMSMSLYLSCHKCPALLLELQVEGVDQVTNYLESLIFLVKTSFCGEWNLEFGSNATEKFEISRGEAE